MDKSKSNGEITTSEWEVMRIVWTLNGATSHELIAALGEKMDWQESTVKTLIRRLQAKNFLKREGATRPYRYTALLSEQAGINLRVDQLFDNLCAMHIGPTILRLVRERELSQSDLTALIAASQAKQATAPKQVACDCMADCGEAVDGGCPAND